MTGLDADQLDRYARHVVLDSVGADGQARLLDGSVLVVGAGGLGAPALQYLAAAGVGTLGIADDDRVERSNLQRQVVHGEADVGRPKTASAADFVEQLNPDVTVRTHDRVTGSGGEESEPVRDGDAAKQLATAYDVVVDATDRFDARYALNDACVATGTPLVYGAVDRTEGQVATFVTDDAPCYRCLFPDADGVAGDCATRGVLGVLPGVIGTIQATEAIKLLLDAGDPLTGRLLVYDAFAVRTDEVTVARDPDCPVCAAATDVEGSVEGTDLAID